MRPTVRIEGAMRAIEVIEDGLSGISSVAGRSIV